MKLQARKRSKLKEKR